MHSTWCDGWGNNNKWLVLWLKKVQGFSVHPMHHCVNHLHSQARLWELLITACLHNKMTTDGNLVFPATSWAEERPSPSSFIYSPKNCGKVNSVLELLNCYFLVNLTSRAVPPHKLISHRKSAFHVSHPRHLGRRAWESGPLSPFYVSSLGSFFHYNWSIFPPVVDDALLQLRNWYCWDPRSSHNLGGSQQLLYGRFTWNSQAGNKEEGACVYKFMRRPSPGLVSQCFFLQSWRKSMLKMRLFIGIGWEWRRRSGFLETGSEIYSEMVTGRPVFGPKVSQWQWHFAAN